VKDVLGGDAMSAPGRRQQEENRSQALYSRALDRVLPTRDARAEFARASRKSAQEERAEVQAFLESKKRMIESHPQMTVREKQAALAEIDLLSQDHATEEAEEDDDPDDEPPPPGGVGYGFFYTPTYRVAWKTGSRLEFSISCPTVAGGNVNSWLYLTATNRTGKGVEAFVSYHVQDEFSFKVYDWAKPDADRWQVDSPYSTLADYLGTLDIVTS
jgi:hypothetical protein